jgi:hypothetical protein
MWSRSECQEFAWQHSVELLSRDKTSNIRVLAAVRGAQAQNVRTVHGAALSTGRRQSIEDSECGCDAGNCQACSFQSVPLKCPKCPSLRHSLSTMPRTQIQGAFIFFRLESCTMGMYTSFSL